MYNMYQVSKPNGDKLAWLDEEEALEKAVSLSKQVGDHPVTYYKLECEEEVEGSDEAPKEWIVDTRQFVRGEMVSQSLERVENQPYVPAPSTKKKGKGKVAKTPEEQAAIDAEKAEKKAKKDAEAAQRKEARAAAKAERDKAREERRLAREADKANRPAKGPRSRLPDDGLIHLLRETNPKRVGTACYPRFDLYQEGMTVKAYKEANPDFGSVDLAWDIDHGFIKVTKADGSDLDPVTPASDEVEEAPEGEVTETPPAPESEQPAA